MKKVINILGALLLLVSLSACGKENTLSDKGSFLDTTGFGNTDAIETTLAGEPKSSIQDTSQATESEVSIIAKSGNAVSSQDKEAVIKELESELDSLFNSINESKDIDGSDLKVD